MMGFGRWSLRRNLLAWMFIPLLALSVLLLIEAYYEARNQADQFFDRTLGGSALAIADRVVLSRDGRLEVDVPYVALEMLTSSTGDRVFYQLRSVGGEFGTGYRDLPPPPEPPAIGGEPVFYDSIFKGNPIRSVARAGAASDTRRSVGFMVIVAETTQGRQGLARETMARSAGRLALLIGVAAIILWFGVKRGLRPLERVSKAVGRRSTDDLRPIEHVVPREAEDLVAAINGLLGRLREALQSMRRFTGNAGHQLRTPLSIARSNLALALRTDDPAEIGARLDEAGRAVGDAERLVEQFLLLARVEESRVEEEPGEIIDLNRLAEETAREQAAGALKSGLELGFEPADSTAWIRGNHVLLRELLINLIDNARRYAAPGKAMLGLSKAGDDWVMEFADDGPGIDAAARKRATSRFDRLTDSSTGGAGLGLAISAEIVERFDGTLTLGPGRDNRGLRVTIRLPASCAPDAVEG